MWVEKGHFYVWGHLYGGNFKFSGGNFINIRCNQSKIVGKIKNFGGNLKNNGGKYVSGIWKCCFNGGIFYNWGQMGANVLVEFENVILIGGIFS